MQLLNYTCKTTYMLDNKAYRDLHKIAGNMRSHTIEPNAKHAGFYNYSFEGFYIERAWPGCLTDLEYTSAC